MDYDRRRKATPTEQRKIDERWAAKQREDRQAELAAMISQRQSSAEDVDSPVKSSADLQREARLAELDAMRASRDGGSTSAASAFLNRGTPAQAPEVAVEPESEDMDEPERAPPAAVTRASSFLNKDEPERAPPAAVTRASSFLHKDAPATAVPGRAALTPAGAFLAKDDVPTIDAANEESSAAPLAFADEREEDEGEDGRRTRTRTRTTMKMRTRVRVRR